MFNKDNATKIVKGTVKAGMVLGYGTFYVAKALTKKVIKESKEGTSFVKDVYGKCKRVIND